MEDMNDHLQKLLPMIPCEKSSNIGIRTDLKEGLGLNKEKPDGESMVTNSLINPQNRKRGIIPVEVKTKDPGVWLKDYNFGIQMEYQVYYKPSDHYQRWNSDQFFWMFTSSQHLSKDNDSGNSQRKFQLNRFGSGLHKFIVKADLTLQVQIPPVLQIPNFPILHTYLETYTRSIRSV